MTRISVIMPAYNVVGFIAEAIESVLAQRGAEFELLIGDDASTDDTAKVIERYRSHPAVRIFRNPYNRGAAATRNALIRAARGTYLTPCDADDIMLSHNLSRQAAFLDAHPEVGVVYSGTIAVWVDDAGRQIRAPELIARGCNRAWDLRENVVNHGGSMSRAHLIAQVGGYDEDVGNVEDWDLWLKLAEITRIHFLEGEALYLWRRRLGSWSAANPRTDANIERIVRAAARRRGFPSPSGGCTR